MTRRRTIAIVGGTGAQGGGLAHAILGDRSGAFAARVLTRRPESARARDLARQGAEVVAADLDHPPSLERAFAGAYGAFCVTNFWEHFSPEREIAQARAMAAAARRAGLVHVIWSTLEDTRRFVPLDDGRMPTLRGRYKVPHFDSKGESDRFFGEAGVPTTYLLTSFYWDNLVHFRLGQHRDEHGRLRIVLPMGDRRLPGIAVEDIGRCAFGIFQRGEDLIGQRVGVAGEHLTGAAMAEQLSCALGEPVDYVAVSPERYRGLDLPGAEELANMFQFKRDFEGVFCGARDVARSRQLNPALQTFAEWLRGHVAELRATAR